MKSNYYTVLELVNNKVSQAIICESKEVAVEKFKTIVSEYGVESDEDMINDAIFESEDGYTVQILQMNY